MSEITIKFLITRARMDALPVGLAEALDSLIYGERVRLRDEVRLMAWFLADDAGKPMEEKAARARLEAMTVADMRSLGDQFGTALRDYYVPPASAAA